MSREGCNQTRKCRLSSGPNLGLTRVEQRVASEQEDIHLATVIGPSSTSCDIDVLDFGVGHACKRQDATGRRHHSALQIRREGCAQLADHKSPSKIRGSARGVWTAIAVDIVQTGRRARRTNIAFFTASNN